MNNVEKQFELLKHIHPDPGFMQYAKNKILSEKPGLSFLTRFQIQPMWMKTVSISFGALLLIFSASFLFPASPTLSSLQNTDALIVEVEALPSGIELQAVHYSDNQNEIIKTAIAEIGDASTRHLQERVIQSEIQTLESRDQKNTEIDALLESVTL